MGHIYYICRSILRDKGELRIFHFSVHFEWSKAVSFLSLVEIHSFIYLGGISRLYLCLSNCRNEEGSLSSLCFLCWGSKSHFLSQSNKKCNPTPHVAWGLPSSFWVGRLAKNVYGTFLLPALITSPCCLGSSHSFSSCFALSFSRIACFCWQCTILAGSVIREQLQPFFLPIEAQHQVNLDRFLMVLNKFIGPRKFVTPFLSCFVIYRQVK